jgi:glycosyltransferase involved in cell wall biosynthesis
MNLRRLQSGSSSRQDDKDTNCCILEQLSLSTYSQEGNSMDIATHLSQEHLNVSVIIPARNEAPNLQHVLPRIPSFVSEVILVDGHSIDDTVTVAQDLLPTIRIVEQVGKGKGDAIRAGLAASTGDMVVLMDADGSADPLEIPRFIETLLAGNEFAKGSRFIKGGGSHDITHLRRAGNDGLILLVNILFGTRFSDLCYGYNAFWSRCLDHIEIDSDGFEIETLINIRMHLAGLKITEVPSIEYKRIHGTSNLNAIRDGWRIWKLIWKEHNRMKRQSVVSATEPERIPEEAVL